MTQPSSFEASANMTSSLNTAPSIPDAAATLSRRLRLLDWTGCALGLTGALTLALNVEISRYGWLAFFGANFAMIAFAKGINARGLLCQQIGFTLTSLLGIYRSFDCVHAACTALLSAFGIH
jgi:hypothetical protein